MYNEDEDVAGDLPEVEEFDPVAHRGFVRDRIWSTTDTGHELTLEEQLFVRSYVIDRNPVAALKRLDYAGSASQLKRIADRHLANPEVQDCIKTLLQRVFNKLDVTAEKVIGQLASMAFFDPRTIMTWDGVTSSVLDSRLWPDEAIAAVQSIKQTKDAGIEIKFADKLAAVSTLGKQLNLLQDPDDTEKKSLADAAAEAAMNKMAEVFRRVAAPPPKQIEESTGGAIH